MQKEKVIKFGKREKIKKSLSKAFAIFNEGKCFYNQDRDELALEKFILAEKMGYESEEMFTYMAWLFGKDADDRTLEYTNKALEFDSENSYTYFLKGSYLYDKSQFDEALVILLKSEELGFDTRGLYTQISYIYETKLDYLKALAYASKAVKKYPDDMYAQYRKASVYYCMNNYQEALKYFHNAEKFGMNDSETYSRISYCYSMLKEHKKALLYANKAILLDKNNPFAYYRKGFIYYTNEDYNKALQAYIAAENLKSDEPYFYDMLARMSWIYQNTKNDMNLAMQYADKAIELNPNDAFCQYRKGCVLSYGLKKYSESLSYLKKAYNMDTSFPEIFFDIANTYMNLKKYKLAIKYIDEGLEIFPKNVDLLKIKAAVLYLMDKITESKSIIEKLLNEDGQDLWLQQAYAMAICEQKDYENVIECLLPIKDKLEEINPFAIFSLGYSYFKTKNFELAIDYILLYSQKEDLALLDYKDKKIIRQLIKALEKKFPDDNRLYEIKENFKTILAKKIK